MQNTKEYTKQSIKGEGKQNDEHQRKRTSGKRARTYREGRKGCCQHPDGGSSYSLSYRLQKILETLEDNVNVFIMGHFHQNILLYGYKSDVALMPGSFQGETSFSIRKGLKNVIGGFILDIDRSSGRIEYTTRWIKL